MAWQRDSFRDYFIDVLGGKASSFNTYSSYLNRIDGEIGGLDEKISQVGAQPVRDWAANCSTGPFETYQTQARSILNSYLGFIEAGGEAAASEPTVEQVDDEGASAPESQALFKLEKEMQQAVRADIGSLEQGLQIIDGGSEQAVSTGKIDILAKDANGQLVAIELKAGACPAGAMEQVLGYAQALADETGQEVRAVLIASSFSDRQRAAAKRTVGLKLRAYGIQMSYKDV